MKKQKRKSTVILSSTYKPKSVKKIVSELDKKGLLKGYLISHPRINGNNLERNPEKYKKSIHKFAKQYKVKLSVKNFVKSEKIKQVSVKKNTQVFVEYKTSKGETKVISQLILSDDKAYKKRKLKKITGIIERYEKNKITKIFSKVLETEGKPQKYKKHKKQSKHSKNKNRR